MLKKLITDHLYKPCYYDNPEFPDRRWAAEALNLCICPYGMYRCHINGCGKKREEHENEEPNSRIGSAQAGIDCLLEGKIS